MYKGIIVGQFFPQLAEHWRALTPSQKSSLGVAVILLLVIAVVSANFASAPHYAQLYGNLTDEDAGSVVKRLKELKVDYRLTGNTIEVPQDRVDDLRLSLASEGKPQGGNPGFELFDKSSFGESEFGEHLRYQRALQGELQRTIGLLESVQTARVHLVLPEHRLLEQQQAPSSASVMLVLKKSPPDPKDVRTVVHLVSSAVEGLDPGNVTVSDSHGDVLTEMGGAADGMALEDHMDMQNKVARDIETRVQSMLDDVLGANKALVRATVAMNFSSARIESETYMPGAANGNGSASATAVMTGVLESEHRVSETYAGARGQAAGGTPALSMPLTAPGQSAGGNNAYNHEDSTTQYRVSKKVEHQDVAPGQVERISLAVLVDKSVSADQLTNLTQPISAAAGLDLSPRGRGDTLSVQPITFDTSFTQQTEKEVSQQQWQSRMMVFAKLGGAGLLALLFLGVVWAILRGMMRTASPAHTPALEEPLTYEMLSVMPSAGPVGNLPENFGSMASPATTRDVPTPNLPPEDAFLYQQLNPLRVAQVVKDMLAEDE